MVLIEKLSDAEIAVLYERQRQIHEEGFNAAHDDAHISGEIARAAGCYAIASAMEDGHGLHVIFARYWPWAARWWKPRDRRRNLVRAAALIIAEIERLDRADAVDRCLACDKPLKSGDAIYPDVSGGSLHAECCGPERENYVNAEGNPLTEGEPIPAPQIYEA